MNEIPSKLNPVTADKPTAPRQIPSNFSLKSTQKSFLKKIQINFRPVEWARVCAVYFWVATSAVRGPCGAPEWTQSENSGPVFWRKNRQNKNKKRRRQMNDVLHARLCTSLEEICIRGPPEKSGARGNQEVLTEKWGKFRNISKIYGRICIIFTTVIVHSLLYGKSFGSKLIG